MKNIHIILALLSSTNAIHSSNLLQISDELDNPVAYIDKNTPLKSVKMPKPEMTPEE